ncbi:exon junction complex subunit, RNA-binding protein Rns1 [Schizosaccharomyces osmophilus]|uniref:Exon junction complex subunit, RNA-binding protein Rns1 n=1 Tax=Schizosaccharomyces osmophilus TaxID=2545709 RepID=A0AAE9W8C9_9SCHI|nr:exon junction complex subunit, RNA-binding protein Rns1 [Schizosaccharomyces osmophilus]WBW71625.1 exon junction complex subunit, RNA-binding protein Rns1 [Schizosaccharomyces osmophilus]
MSSMYTERYTDYDRGRSGHSHRGPSPYERSMSRSSGYSYRSHSRGSYSSASPSSRSISRSPERAQTTVFVENLTRNVTREHIAEIFGIYGRVNSIHMPLYRKSKTNMGFCYIDYSYPNQAANAVDKMNNGELDGEELFLSLKRPERRNDRKRFSKVSDNSYRPNRFDNDLRYRRGRSPSSRSPRSLSRNHSRDSMDFSYSGNRR